mgnify:CR=1 FL=1
MSKIEIIVKNKTLCPKSKCLSEMKILVKNLNFLSMSNFSTKKIIFLLFRNLQSQQNYNRDNELISRLIRETRFEKHLAAHLIAVRREKTVMTENRRQLNEQFEQVRQKIISKINIK